MKSTLTLVFGILIGAFGLHFYQKISEEPAHSDIPINDKPNATNDKIDVSPFLEEMVSQSRDSRDNQKKQQTSAELVTTKEPIQSNPPEKVDLPNQEEENVYRAEFQTAIERFYGESIDYDWVDEVEVGFYEQLAMVPEEISSSLVEFSCHTDHCILELEDIDFNNQWAPVFGELSNQEWWSFGRVHFEPYPIPNSTQDYIIVLERIKISER